MKIYLESERISPHLLSVKRKNILTGLGVPEVEADEYLTSLIDEIIDLCFDMCDPKAAVSIWDQPVFSKETGIMTLEGVTFNLNKMVTSSLYSSNSLALFAGTCGDKTGKYSSQLLKDGYALEGLIADLIGSEIAEGVAEYIHSKLSADMDSIGIKSTNRYSPGYCNWPVSDQQQLFRLLGTNNCGIKLTKSSLMLPIKSVSGVIGLGPNVVNRGYACAWCDSDHCLYRDKGRQ